jgi:ParD-like antitoxin of type II bacterial toxin-antitoxin system
MPRCLAVEDDAALAEIVCAGLPFTEFLRPRPWNNIPCGIRVQGHARSTAPSVACCYARSKLLQMEETMADRVTRVAADLVDSAAAEGARQSRSAKQQLDHWARVGRAVSSQHSASRRRVEAVLAGDLPMGELSVEEGVVFNAEVSAAIEERLAHSNYGDALAARGVTTVALNDAGEIVEYRPDGTSTVLNATR